MFELDSDELKVGLKGNFPSTAVRCLQSSSAGCVRMYAWFQG